MIEFFKPPQRPLPGTSDEEMKKYKNELEKFNRGTNEEIEKAEHSAVKFSKNTKWVVSVIFGVLALLWLVVMLPAQSDFLEIIIGWVVIGVIYLIIRIYSANKK